MEPETLRAYVSENRELEQKLTKRNQQYIFDLKKSLDAANLSEEEKAVVLHDMLPTLVQEQKGGRTARQLFGTVSEKTAAILDKPETTDENTSPLWMWMDNSLFILGIFGLVMGIMGIFVEDSAQVYGVLTLVLLSMVGGWVFYLMYKYMYQFERPGADKSKRPKIWKTMLVMTGAVLVWVAAIALSTALIPQAINVILDPLVLAVLGGLALALRFYLKKKFNIRSSLAATRR